MWNLFNAILHFRCLKCGCLDTNLKHAKRDLSSYHLPSLRSVPRLRRGERSVMLPTDDFSTNRFSGTNEPAKPHVEHPVPSRHPDLCFNDGNLAVLASGHYFLVHQGLLCRHSAPLAAIVKTLEGKQTRFLEGRVVLELPDASNDVFYFLLALYDGMYVILP